MKKIFKNKIILIALLLFFIVGAIVGAASEYYKFVWNSKIVKVLEHNGYVTNDIVRDGNNLVSVGFKYYTNSNGYSYAVPTFVVFDSDGEIVNDVDLVTELDFVGYSKRILKVEDGFISFVFDEHELYILKFNSKYEFVDSYNFYIDEEYDDGPYIESYEIFLEEDEDNYYIIPGSRVDRSIFVVKKDFSSGEIYYGPYYDKDTSDSISSNYPDKAKQLYNIYGLVLNDEFVVRNVGSAEYIYEPRFVIEINDNYLFGIYNKDINKSIVRLVNPNEEEANQLVWEKEFEEKFINTAVMFNNKILLADNKSIQILDLDGEVIAEDLLSNYIDSESIGFISEHFIYIDNEGFALTGTEEICPIEIPDDSGITDIKKGPVPEMSGDIPLLPDGSLPPLGATEADKGGEEAGTIVPDAKAEDSNCGIAEVLYFSVIHRITTKTDGNGTITVSQKTASWGDSITYKITPNEGFVLGEVKVYDINGNPVEFEQDGNSFTMPNIDVIIDVTFTVENVDTLTFVSLSIIIIVIISVIILIKVRKKAKFYEV